MSAFWKLHRVALGLGLVSALVYAFQAYALEREQTLLLWTSFGILFAAYLYFIQREKLNFRFLLGLGIGFRLLFLCAEPFPFGCGYRQKQFRLLDAPVSV